MFSFALCNSRSFPTILLQDFPRRRNVRDLGTLISHKIAIVKKIKTEGKRVKPPSIVAGLEFCC
jgi:hypothetical protein